MTSMVTGTGRLLIERADRCLVEYQIPRDTSGQWEGTIVGGEHDELIMSDAHASKSVQLKLADGTLLDITILDGGLNAIRQFKAR